MPVGAIGDGSLIPGCIDEYDSLINAGTGHGSVWVLLNTAHCSVWLLIDTGE